MNDILKIIFSIFDFSSERNLREKNDLTKKQKKIAYLVLVLCITIPLIVILFIEN